MDTHTDTDTCTHTNSFYTSVSERNFDYDVAIKRWYRILYNKRK